MVETTEETTTEDADSIVRSDIKDAIDSYEAFVDEYCDFMKDYEVTDFSKLTQYTALLTKELEMTQKFAELKSDDWTTAELLYYETVSLRCSSKMLEAAYKIGK